MNYNNSLHIQINTYTGSKIKEHVNRVELILKPWILTQVCIFAWCNHTDQIYPVLHLGVTTPIELVDAITVDELAE